MSKCYNSCRSITGVRGFTRQVLIAVVALVETTEFRRIELLNEGSPPENPRSSTTDDVECFFSVTRDLVGKNFTLKQVQIGWRKICLEFEKRTNPDLPFYYYTSNHDRFYEGDRPSFDMQPAREKVKRIPVVESSVLFRSGRASIPLKLISHLMYVRAKFQNLPASCPPPPNIPIDLHEVEHSYAASNN